MRPGRSFSAPNRPVRLVPTDRRPITPSLSARTRPMLARLLYHTARVRTDTDETANSRGGIPSLGKLDKIPGFRDLIAGRCVLDFGCGRGYEVVAMALAGAARVVGLDIQ